MRALTYASSFLLLVGTAAADPADLPSRAADQDPSQALTVIDARGCEGRSAVCITPGARSTVAAESQPVASTSKHPAAAVPRFARVGKGPWTIDVQASLKRAAVAGNALFVLYDTEDPRSVENHEYTAMYQTSIRAGRSLALRLSFEHEEGFRAGHTYRLRVVQLLGGKEVPLVETDFTLL